MQKRHQDRQLYFNEQSLTTRKYVIPYIQKHKTIGLGTRVLEIGCGEGGNIPPFLEAGCSVVGIDISKPQVERAREFLADHPQRDQLSLIVQDIYQVDPQALGTFDLIVMRDVIEHIPDQERFMAFLKPFLKTDGLIFFGFPPWYMPFGGHQQGCRNKYLSVLPWYHLLPAGIYRRVLRAGGESEGKIEHLLANKRTGISIERFQRILRKLNYKTIDRTLYLFNPNYEVKFKLKPVVQLPILRNAIFIRNFYTTCAYYLVGHPDLPKLPAGG